MEYIHTNADGSTTKYTEDMIKNAIQDRNHWQDKYYESIRDRVNNRSKVYDFFQERYSPNDDEFTVSVDDVNDLLESIGSSKLKSLFTVTGTINFVVTDIEAETEQEANDIVHDTMSLDFGGDGNLDEWDIDISDTSQQ
jgi:hypothetical protein